MHGTGSADGVRLREVLPADVPIFYRNQLDPQANELAAFPARSWDEFLRHRQQQLLGNSTTLEKTVLAAGGAVAGHILSWRQDDRRFLGYWLGREHWGKGIATAALQQFLEMDLQRPLFAQVALHNRASQRVLEKCGLRRMGGPQRASDGVEEYLYCMDADTDDPDLAAYTEGLLAALPSSLWHWLPPEELRRSVQAELADVVQQRMRSPERAERYAQRCPVAGCAPADYELRDLPVCGGASVLAGIHFKNLRLDQPFVGVYAQTRMLTTQEVVAASAELGVAFAAFAPRLVCWWSPEQHDLRSAPGAIDDQRLIAAPLRQLAGDVGDGLGQPRPLPEGITLRRDPSGSSFPTYAALFEDFWSDHPDWRAELEVTEEDDYRQCARSGCLVQVELEGQIVGILAARLGGVRGIHGWEMLDEILARSLRGRGWAAAVQWHFLQQLDARAPLVWGTIAARNVPSRRAALRVGRKDLGGWVFLPAG